MIFFSVYEKWSRENCKRARDQFVYLSERVFAPEELLFGETLGEDKTTDRVSATLSARLRSLILWLSLMKTVIVRSFPLPPLPSIRIRNKSSHDTLSIFYQRVIFYVNNNVQSQETKDIIIL